MECVKVRLFTTKLKNKKINFFSASACLLRGKSQCAQVIICLSQINLENKKNSFFHLHALFYTLGGRGFSCEVSDVDHNCKTENVKSIALSYSLALIIFWDVIIESGGL